MKYIKNLAVALLTMSYSACSGLLDVDESVGIPEENVFEFVDRVTRALTTAYTFLPTDFAGVDGTMRSCATDDAEFVWNTSSIRFMNDGSWSPQNVVDTQWGNFYTGIRATNLFLENFTLEAIEVYKYQALYDNYLKQLTNYQYEARFLRAFFHFELAKRYGAIPLATKTFTPDEVNHLVRTPFMEVIDFIVKECDAVAKELPSAYTAEQMPGAETGRITKGAAMALKARALLHAASPLHNPNHDVERWKTAAKASLDLIDSAVVRNWYKLPAGAYNTNVLASTELILERREAKSNSFEKSNYPIGIDGGNTGVCPSQNLVDAFETSSGEPFDWNNPEHAKAPYTKRDPRLAKTILFDGALLKGTTIDVAYGGKNAAPKAGASKTGYYLLKFLVPTVNFTPPATTADHCWPLFRYGEVLLNYAEAMNEAFPGNTAYTDAVYSRSAQWALNQIRSRAGMPPVAGLDEPQFRAKVRNERRVELAFEDHRFWDIRRWKIGEDVQIYGTQVVQQGAGRVYVPNQVVATRKWHSRMYLYPIPAFEIFVNAGLGQNPEW